MIVTIGNYPNKKQININELVWEDESEGNRIRLDVTFHAKNNSYMLTISNRKQENGMVQAAILVSTDFGKADLRKVFDSVESAQEWTIKTAIAVDGMFDGLNGTESMELTSKLAKKEIEF